MSDPRFTRLTTDPRFRRPRRQRSKIAVDDRFKEIFDQGKGQRERPKTARSIDKYGRVLPDNNDRDNLRRFYSTGTHDGKALLNEFPAVPDFARGEILLESSDEDDGERDDATGQKGVTPHEPGPSKLLPAHAEIDLDENDFADLDAQAAAYSRNLPAEDDQQEGTKTRRLAVVNLDWDHVRASHLFKIFSSLVSPTAPMVPSTPPTNSKGDPLSRGGSINVVRGKILSVSVYPSQLGKEWLSREEKEGPPIELFGKKSQVNEEEVNEQNIYEEGDENECDEDALRNYQLMRLRYYYAIVTCDTAKAASHIYSEMQGTELERSANVFELSFVPDDMTFDDIPRDEATEDQPFTYKATDFVTAALRHSKVKLTWDEDDPERNQITRRTLTRREIEEADFKAYLASSTSGSDSEADQFSGNAEPRSNDEKSVSRSKLRALLLGSGDEELPEGWGKDGGDDKSDVDMEITFMPALDTAKGDRDETTLEKYQKKVKEKRKRRKDRASEKSGKTTEAREEVKDDFFDTEGEETGTENLHVRPGEKTAEGGRDSNATTRIPTTAEELELLIASDQPDAEPAHFSLKSILKDERGAKLKGRKRRKMGKGLEVDETRDDFVINLKDDRFKSLHEDHQFAIDPSNPHFKKTKNMVALLQERARMARHHQEFSETASPKKGDVEGARNLLTLVQSVKQKSAAAQQPGTGKRRRV